MNDLNINDLLKDALNSEIKAKEFYENASEKAQSQAGKKFFKEMADFEQNHYTRVKKVIESLDQGIKIEGQETQSDSPSVRSEVEGEFEPNKDEIVNVINLAIEAEKNAQERYRTIAGLLTSEEEINIFNDLANEERNHQKMLEDQFYHISNKGTIIWD